MTKSQLCYIKLLLEEDKKAHPADSHYIAKLIEAVEEELNSYNNEEE